jgi:hypothetical protein
VCNDEAHDHRIPSVHIDYQQTPVNGDLSTFRPGRPWCARTAGISLFRLGIMYVIRAFQIKVPFRGQESSRRRCSDWQIISEFEPDLPY